MSVQLRAFQKVAPTDSLDATVFSDVKGADVASGAVLQMVGLLSDPTDPTGKSNRVGLVIQSATSKKPILLDMSFNDLSLLVQSLATLQGLTL
jgi:hypothetical protein